MTTEEDKNMTTSSGTSSEAGRDIRDKDRWKASFLVEVTGNTNGEVEDVRFQNSEEKKKKAESQRKWREKNREQGLVQASFDGVPKEILTDVNQIVRHVVAEWSKSKTPIHISKALSIYENNRFFTLYRNRLKDYMALPKPVRTALLKNLNDLIDYNCQHHTDPLFQDQMLSLVEMALTNVRLENKAGLLRKRVIHLVRTF